MHITLSLNCFVQAGLLFEPDQECRMCKTKSKSLQKTELKHLIIAFIILGAGCFVGLIVFLLEMIIGRGKKVQEAQQGRETENQNLESYSLDWFRNTQTQSPGQQPYYDYGQMPNKITWKIALRNYCQKIR